MFECQDKLDGGDEDCEKVEILHSFQLTKFLLGVLQKTNATKFMLCLDEVTKCPEVDKLLSAIAQCLDRTKSCSMFLVTALDPLIFESKTKSQREIIWVPLPLLTEQQSLSLFETESPSSAFLHWGTHPAIENAFYLHCLPLKKQQ